MLDAKNTRAVLSEFAKVVRQQARLNLTKGGSNTSKDLWNSIDYEIISDEQAMLLGIVMEDYGVFIDQGVRGKDPSAMPAGAKSRKQKAPNSPFRFGTGSAPKGEFKSRINAWIVRKGIAPRDENGKFVSRKSLNFMIRRSIYLTGIRPTLFLTNPFEKAYKDLPNDVTEGYAKDVENFIVMKINKQNDTKQVTSLS